MDKIFFYDLGIRNTIIDNLNLLNSRNDIGQLWENFLISERLKKNSCVRHYCSSHFWRLHSGAEIDYLEDYGGKLHGYEFKWSNKKVRPPKSWQETYPNSKFKLINKDNYLNFVVQAKHPLDRS